MTERSYIWAEEPANWGAAERGRLDRLFYAMLSSERVRAAVGAFWADDGIDMPTLLVEIGTFITSLAEPLAALSPPSGDAPLSNLLLELQGAFESAGMVDDSSLAWKP